MSIPFIKKELFPAFDFAKAKKQLEEWGLEEETSFSVDSSETAIVITFKSKWWFYNPYSPFMVIFQGNDQSRLAYRVAFNPAPLILGVPMIVVMCIYGIGEIGVLNFLFFSSVIVFPSFLVFWSKEGKLRKQVFGVLGVREKAEPHTK